MNYLPDLGMATILEIQDGIGKEGISRSRHLGGRLLADAECEYRAESPRRRLMLPIHGNVRSGWTACLSRRRRVRSATRTMTVVLAKCPLQKRDTAIASSAGGPRGGMSNAWLAVPRLFRK